MAASPPTEPGGGPVYNPFDPAVRRDPYDAYGVLRATRPVWHLEGAGVWFVSRHADATAVLHDRRFSAHEGQQVRRREGGLPPSMLSTDPPQHTRLRHAVQGCFTPSHLAALTERAAARVRSLAGGWAPGQVIDAVTDVARPVVLDVLCRLMGVPDSAGERAFFAAQAAAVAPELDPLLDPAAQQEADAALDDLLAWFADLLGERRAHPRDSPDGDVLDALVHAHGAGTVDPGEALTTCALLVIGGFEPLVDLVAGGLALVAASGGGERPHLYGGWSTLVDEVLRYDAPIQFAARVPTEDVSVGGERVGAGQPVVVLLGSANRDPAAFDGPDRFHPARRPNPHLAFGTGTHHCLGAGLSRQVAAAVFATLAERFPAMRPAARPVVRDTLVPRGPAWAPLFVA